MDLPAILRYRTARVAVRQPDGTLITTEGEEQQVLYITQDGKIGGTGRVATNLMQSEMMSIRAEIIRFSNYPVCNYVWKFKSDDWKLQVRFTSPWQSFAQLAWSLSPEGYRCTAWAYFARAPGEVSVRMGPSGRVVGKASQTLTAGHGSPITCSIEIEYIIGYDLIVIFQPDDPALAPVLSQAFPRSATEWDVQVAELVPHYFDEITTTVLNSSSIQDVAPSVDVRANNTDATQSGSYMNVSVPLWSSNVTPFDSQAGRPGYISRQYCSPYTDNSSSASDSTLDSRSDLRHTQSVTTTEVGAQEDTIDDRCIVVIPLP